MITKSILLALTLATSPDAVTPPIEQICTTTPVEPERVDAQPFSSTAADGTQTWGATATYRLSSGALGEAFLVIDSNGVGEAQLMIDGEIISHVAIGFDPATGQLTTTTWHPPEVAATPEAIAEAMQVDLPLIVVDGLPQAFKCSAFRKKAMRLAGALWRAGIAAAGVTCCALTAPSLVGCAVCAAGSATGIYEGGKVIDEHCE